MARIKTFVLLLVLIIPLSGCVNGPIGDANAQDTTGEGGTTIVNNFYNNSTTTSVVRPEVMTYHFQPSDENSSFSLDFDGTFTYKIETLHSEIQVASAVGDPTVYWRSNNAELRIEMMCNDVQIIGYGSAGTQAYLPVLPNQSCEVTFIPMHAIIIVFSNSSLIP